MFPGRILCESISTFCLTICRALFYLTDFFFPHALLSQSFTYLIDLAGKVRAWVHSQATTSL